MLVAKSMCIVAFTPEARRNNRCSGSLPLLRGFSSVIILKIFVRFESRFLLILKFSILAKAIYMKYIISNKIFCNISFYKISWIYVSYNNVTWSFEVLCYMHNQAIRTNPTCFHIVKLFFLIYFYMNFSK